MTVDIYIDTSIKGPKRRDGTCLYIIAVQTAAGVADAGNMEQMEDTTESSLTLAALEKALERITKPCELVIHLECDYVAAALQNRWFEQWREHGWMTAKGKEVSDAEKWRHIEYLLNAHGFEVRLKEPHSYREWMQRTLKEPAIFKEWLDQRTKKLKNGEKTK